jgi:hypothetical protein
MLSEKNRSYQDSPLLTRIGAGQSGTWRCDRVNAVYLKRFLRLAGEIHARVYVLVPPFSPGLLSAEEYSGEEARYIAFIRRIRDQYPQVVVVDGRHSGYKADVFVDGAHLDRDGAAALSAGLGHIMRRTADEEAHASRWIELPSFAPASTQAKLEVLSESMAIARLPRPPETATR